MLLTAAELLGCAASPASPGSVPARDAATNPAQVAVAPAPQARPPQAPPPVDAGRALTPSQNAGASAPRLDAGAPSLVDAAVEDAGPAARSGRVWLTFTTKPLLAGSAPSFAPRNIVAVWIEGEGARPVKVLAVYAWLMRLRLQRFNEHVPGFSRNSTPPDVIARATRPDHSEPIQLSWDLSDRQGQPVPDGHYTALIEVTDRNDRTMLAELAFDIGTQPQRRTLPEAAELGPVELRFEP